ncbi:ribonuclease H-like domain-containing protein [Mycena crocata]|nr:ribonuclease H-like domain-containing protein [Mycena crocata]
MYTVTAWTAGACLESGQPGVIAGAGVWFGKRLNGSRAWKRALWSSPTPTDQRAELAAVVMALKMARNRRNTLDNGPFFLITIRTSSKYAVGAFSKEWVESWIAHDWRNADGFEIYNRDLIEEGVALIDDLRRHGEVEMTWIPSEENEQASALALEACNDQLR